MWEAGSDLYGRVVVIYLGQPYLCRRSGSASLHAQVPVSMLQMLSPVPPTSTHRPTLARESTASRTAGEVRTVRAVHILCRDRALVDYQVRLRVVGGRGGVGLSPSSCSTTSPPPAVVPYSRVYKSSVLITCCLCLLRAAYNIKSALSRAWRPPRSSRWCGRCRVAYGGPRPRY